jgi:hypothetical protein
MTRVFFFTELATFKLFLGSELIDEDSALMFKDTVSMVFEAAIVCASLFQTSSADIHHICR